MTFRKGEYYKTNEDSMSYIPAIIKLEYRTHNYKYIVKILTCENKHVHNTNESILIKDLKTEFHKISKKQVFAEMI